MTDHNRTTQLLARRSELDTSQLEKLQQHLSICPPCAETSEAFSRQDTVFSNLAGQRPTAPSVRATVLRAAWYAQFPRRRLRLPAILLAVATAATAFAGYATAVGDVPWVQPDRKVAQGFQGPNSGLFAPMKPSNDLLSKSEAIALAIPHGDANGGQLQAHIAADAFLGTYRDTLFIARPVWIVYFHGPGLKMSSDGGPPLENGAVRCKYLPVHEETVIIDARKGVFLEEDVGLIPKGLPVTPEPRANAAACTKP